MTLSPRPHTRTWPALALVMLFALSTAACGFCNPEEEGEGQTEAPEKPSEDDAEDKDAAKDKKADKPKRADAKTKRADAKDPKKDKQPRSIKDKKNALSKRADAKPALDKIKRPNIKNVGKPGAGAGIDMDFAKTGGLAAKKPGNARADAPPDSPAATKLEDLEPKKDEGTTDLAAALTRGSVRSATGYTKMLRPGPLVGINTDKSYDALRLRPTDRNKFGVALQVWREKNPGAQSRKFNDLLRQYPDSKRTRDIGDTSFKAAWGGMSYIVWLDRKNKLIAAISCDGDICKDDAAALKLASGVSKKLR